MSSSRSAGGACLCCSTGESNAERWGISHAELLCHGQPHSCGCVDEGMLYVLFCFHDLSTYRSRLYFFFSRLIPTPVVQWMKVGYTSCFHESAHKGVNQRSKYVTQVKQERPESPTVILTWHACKYKVHILVFTTYPHYFCGCVDDFKVR